MIFIILGSREYQFNRLLEKIDNIIEKNELKYEVFGQIGSSTYKPKNFKYVDYLSQEDFKKYQKKSKLVISHGGTGALVSSLKLEKRVIGVPRMEKFSEHTDDHQFQIIEMLEKQKYIVSCLDEELSMLEDYILNYKKLPLKKYENQNNVIEIILDFMKGK